MGKKKDKKNKDKKNKDVFVKKEAVTEAPNQTSKPAKKKKK